VFADITAGSVDAQSVTVDPSNRPAVDYPLGVRRLVADGYVVAEWADNIETFDPSSLSTPFVDAVDAINATFSNVGGGTIHLPRGTTTDNSSQIGGLGDKHVIGQGTGDNSRTVLELTDTSGEGFLVGSSRDLEDSTWQDMVLSGSSASARQTAGGTATQAFNISAGDPDQWELDQVIFEQWGDKTINLDTGNPFDCSWGYVEFARASCLGRNIYQNSGCMLQIDYLRGNSSDGGWIIDAPGAASGAKIAIGGMNVGDAPAGAVRHEAQEGAHISINWLNFEPSDDTNTTRVVQVKNGSSTHVGKIVNFADVDHVVEIRFGARDCNIRSRIRSTGAIANNPIQIVEAPAGPSQYGGTLADVGTTLSAGSLSEPATVYAANGPFTN
jgi:hypothetical protein